MATIEIRDILDNETGKTIFPRTHVDAVIGLKDFSFFEEKTDPQDSTKKYIQLKEEYTGLLSPLWMAAGGIGRGGGGSGLIDSVLGVADLNTPIVSESLTETFSSKAIQTIWDAVKALQQSTPNVLLVNGQTNSTLTVNGVIADFYTKSQVDAIVGAVYRPAGNAASVSALGALTAANIGKVYNMTASFTTTADFLEGAGKTFPAGTNVVIVDAGSGTYKYDVLSGFVDLSGYALKVGGSGYNFRVQSLILPDGSISSVGASFSTPTPRPTWSFIDNISSLTPTTVTKNIAFVDDIPTALKNPNALTFGSKTYDGSAAREILASDLGALTAHQTVTLASGTNNGTLKLTTASGTVDNIAVKGLQALAYQASLLASDIPDISGTYVTLAGAQTITGAKTFSADLTLSENLVMGAAKHIDLGPARIEYDANTGAIHVTTNQTGNNAPTIGFYVDGFNAAGGIGAGSGGGYGVEQITSNQDGTVDFHFTGGDITTVDLNHTHSQYTKVQICQTKAEYDAITTKDSMTFYLIPEVAMYLGSTLILGQASPLPYTPVPWIATDGTAYINTGIQGNSPMSAYCKMLPVAPASGTAYFFGHRSSTNGRFVFLMIGSNKYAGFTYAGSAFTTAVDVSTSIDNQTPIEVKTSVKMGEQIFSVKKEGDAQYTDYHDSLQTTVSDGIDILLFCYNNRGTPSAPQSGTRCYGAKIYSDADFGTILFDGIPCYFNGEYGLWDLVSNSFFGNDAESGAFIGPQI